MQVKAAVLSRQGKPFQMQDLDLAEPQADEVLVRIAAVGLCHSDLAVVEGGLKFPLPGVLGHEGAGIVEKVGPAVSGLSPGDHVVLSFDSCGECPSCQTGTPSYCNEFASRNFGGSRPDSSATLRQGDMPLAGSFFGQSSFANHALARERNAIKVDKDLPLHLLGPLGCGIQTGAGAVLETLQCRSDSTLLVIGAGAVGLAAVMAGVISKCAKIIVVEPVEDRRRLALDLGATHALAPGNADEAAIRAIVPGGMDYVLDSSARPQVLELALNVLVKRGTIAMVGVPFSPDTRWPLDFLKVTRLGATIKGVVEGDADPRSFIPKLIEYYREGRFPFERMISLYPFDRINDAISDQRKGVATKVVLQF